MLPVPTKYYNLLKNNFLDLLIQIMNLKYTYLPFYKIFQQY